MTLQQLYYFQTIAKYQHYHKAANEMHVTQPSLSKAMANLEEELGVVLFEKQGRNVTLSKYGEMFLRHVDRILEEKELAEKELKQMLDESTGHIDIGYVAPVARHYIPRMVRQFLEEEQNKEVTFSFTQAFTSQMIQQLKDKEFDVIFASMVEQEEELEFVPVLQEELVVIVAPQHPLAERRSIQLKELEAYPNITYDSGSAMGKYVRKVFQKEGIHLNPVCIASDESSIMALVAENFGVAYVAMTWEVKEMIEKGKIVKLDVEDQQKYRTLYMIYKKDRYQIPAVRNFIRYAGNWKESV